MESKEYQDYVEKADAEFEEHLKENGEDLSAEESLDQEKLTSRGQWSLN